MKRCRTHCARARARPGDQGHPRAPATAGCIALPRTEKKQENQSCLGNQLGHRSAFPSKYPKKNGAFLQRHAESSTRPRARVTTVTRARPRARGVPYCQRQDTHNRAHVNLEIQSATTKGSLLLTGHHGDLSTWSNAERSTRARARVTKVIRARPRRGALLIAHSNENTTYILLPQ